MYEGNDYYATDENLLKIKNLKFKMNQNNIISNITILFDKIN
jgi:hypothetical protein